MRNVITFILFLLCVSTLSFGQSKDSYQYTLDLTNVVDDKVYVELTAPPISSDEITFYLPKIIPGTYAIEDYGRFVSKFEALNKKGKALPVEKLDTNSWKIKNANQLVKIRYWIEDSFDTSIEGPEIFWPAGTNIEEGKNFLINSGGFFGYFEGMKKIPFQFNVIKPEGFYGATGMIAEQTNAPISSLKLEKKSTDNTKKVDVYKTADYDQLVDSPLMYAKPDTAVIKVANAEVLIGSYSPNKKISAQEIAASIREVLKAQAEFLGGKLPVNKYAFIFYFTTQPIQSYGALEHSYSSMYFMPEMTIDQMNQQLRDFAAHEFFHIVTPLTVHSEEIDNFDFNDPKMSQHLWMYEGMTEYFAGNVQVRYNLITPEQYLQMLREKMVTADQFPDDLPFTELSKYTLDKYHDMYYNVYMKGALIGLCLDIKLRQLSDGKYGTPNLLMDLSKKFGKNKAFKDDELFDIITQMTYPEIGEFFNKYVKGSESLPLQETLALVGVNYQKEEKYEDFSLGIGQDNVGVTQVESKPYLYISNADNLNDMGKAVGFQAGDVLVKINGETIPDLGPQLGAFIYKQQQGLKEGATLTYGVLRKDEGGEMKEVELSAPVKKIELSRKHLLKFMESPTPEQLALRNAWLKP